MAAFLAVWADFMRCFETPVGGSLLFLPPLDPPAGSHIAQIAARLSATCLARLNACLLFHTIDASWMNMKGVRGILKEIERALEGSSEGACCNRWFLGRKRRLSWNLSSIQIHCDPRGLFNWLEFCTNTGEKWANGWLGEGHQLKHTAFAAMNDTSSTGHFINLEIPKVCQRLRARPLEPSTPSTQQW